MAKNIIPITGNVRQAEREERMHSAQIAWQIYSKPQSLIAWVQEDPANKRFAFCVGRDTSEIDGWFIPLVYTTFFSRTMKVPQML